ncbi:nucleotidyltransferase domain-containing protein [Candidatus Woesearchaeota archaeon]|nr:nucleotidyltransferase domain-containing protein [Candidatus Woesearchaeota archaeon]
MTLRQIAVKEQLIKTVVKSGNGGAVWVPKTWLGQEVVVILPEKPKRNIKEQILHLLEPHLQDILSVAIYGSHARHEATENSDIDVLVITKDKQFKILTLDGKMEFLVLPLQKMTEAIEKYPAIYYQIVQEAEPLINASALQELNTIPLQKKSILAYLKETKEHIKSNKEFIELDKLDGKYLRSFSVLYSLLLRLRAVFILHCISRNTPFSNKKFKQWLVEEGIHDFPLLYVIYQKLRDNKNVGQVNIKITTVEKITLILEREMKKLEENL